MTAPGWGPSCLGDADRLHGLENLPYNRGEFCEDVPHFSSGLEITEGYAAGRLEFHAHARIIKVDPGTRVFGRKWRLSELPHKTYELCVRLNVIPAGDDLHDGRARRGRDEVGEDDSVMSKQGFAVLL